LLDGITSTNWGGSPGIAVGIMVETRSATLRRGNELVVSRFPAKL
jgi:hypothetical protein